MSKKRKKLTKQERLKILRSLERSQVNANDNPAGLLTNNPTENVKSKKIIALNPNDDIYTKKELVKIIIVGSIILAILITIVLINANTKYIADFGKKITDLLNL